jgi:hypothetical protein
VASTTPPDLVALMREELRNMRHLPDEGLRAKRARLEVARKRVGVRFQWGELTEDEYRDELGRLTAELTELPLAADSNLVALTGRSSRSCPSGRSCGTPRPSTKRRLWLISSRR